MMRILLQNAPVLIVSNDFETYIRAGRLHLPNPLHNRAILPEEIIHIFRPPLIGIYQVQKHPADVRSCCIHQSQNLAWHLWGLFVQLHPRIGPCENERA